MRLGTIEVTHEIDCKCGRYTARGGTVKRAYFWMTLHVCLHHPDGPPLLKTLWQLWRWNPRPSDRAGGGE